MDKFENLQTNNEKQHYIPMEVTAETIKDFGINCGCGMDENR